MGSSPTDDFEFSVERAVGAADTSAVRQGAIDKIEKLLGDLKTTTQETMNEVAALAEKHKLRVYVAPGGYGTGMTAGPKDDEWSDSGCTWESSSALC